MASLQNRNGSYKLTFCYHGKRHYLTLGKVSEQEAEAKSAQVDYLLLRIRQRLVQVPPGVPIEEFVQHDGEDREARAGRRDAPLVRPVPAALSRHPPERGDGEE